MKKMPIVPPHDHAEDFYNDDNVFEVLEDFSVGDTPTQLGTGGVWAESYDSDTNIVYRLLAFGGDLYAAGGDGVYRYSDGAWARVLTVASGYCHCLCVFNSQLYAFFRSAGYIYRTSNGTDWTNVTPIGWNTFAGSAAIVWNGIFFVSCPWGEVWYSTNGTSWTQTLIRQDDMQYGWGFAVLGANLYVAMSKVAGGAIYKFDGASWTRVLLIATGYGFQAIYTWNNKLYAGSGTGEVYSSADGTNWSAALALPTAGVVREFIEYSGKLLANSNDKVYETLDGLTWTLFYDCPETSAYCFAFYDGVLFMGTSADGKIYSYTDNDYIPAPTFTAFGDATIWGQLRPGNAPGIPGSILLSDAPSFNIWLPPGTSDQFLRGGLVPSWAKPDNISSFSMLCYEGDVLTYENEVIYG